MEIMIALEKYKEEPEPLSWARVFSVPEWAKSRRRPICEPLVNDYFTDERIPTVRFLTADERRQLIAKKVKETGRCVAKCYDFASYYDQLGLGKEVARYFCVKSGGKTWSAQTIPMGFRPSCAVAQALTWAMVDFKCDVLILTYIDNVVFIGDEAKVQQASTIFEQRCKHVGAVLSEASEVSEEFDFLGEHFNLRDCTTELTTKTIDKLKQVEKVLETVPTMTRREVAAVFGLAIFSSGILHHSLAHEYLSLIHI